MRTLGAAAALILLTAGFAASPAGAQSSGSVFSGHTRIGSSMVAMNQSAPKAGRNPRCPGRGWGWNGDRPHDGNRWRKRCMRRGWCRGERHDHDSGYAYGWGGGYGYGYSGIGDDSLLANAYGYFAQDGTGAKVDGGEVHYDYDRGYPYDYYFAERRPFEMSSPPLEYRRRECTMQPARDRRTGGNVEVRICRN